MAKQDKNKKSRFAYSDSTGLKVVSKSEVKKSEEVNWLEKPIDEILKGFGEDLLNEEQLEVILIEKTGDKNILNTVFDDK